MSIKYLIRKYVYPIYLFLIDKLIHDKYETIFKLKFDKIYIGQRGNDFNNRHLIVNRNRKIEGKTLLIIGCGIGNDIESWLRFKPAKIIAIDFFNYELEWEKRKIIFSEKYHTQINFFQADAENLSIIDNESVDFICSDAVYQHLKEFEKVINELDRVLKTKGIMYASMGPLHYSFGGDIISGSSSLKNGFNHILLKEKDYQRHLNRVLDKSNPYKFYFDYNMFSYLKTMDYISIIENYNYKCFYKSCIISEKTIKFKKKYQNLYKKLLKVCDERDLLINTLSLIYEKQ